MREVHSGTTAERILRNAGLALLVVVFACWFLWDGYVGYSRENAATLVNSLGLNPTQIPAVNSNLTADEARQLLQEVAEGTALEEVQYVLGDPSLEHNDAAYYVGPGGYIVVHLARGRVQQAGWRHGLHTESELRWQRWIGYVMALAGLVSVIHLIRVVTTRVSLTDAGLKVRGKPVIPFEAMTVLSTGKQGDPGAVAIEYSIGGRAGLIRLDSYVVKELPAIVSDICERAGFPHPWASSSDQG